MPYYQLFEITAFYSWDEEVGLKVLNGEEHLTRIRLLHSFMEDHKLRPTNLADLLGVKQEEQKQALVKQMV